MDRPESEARDGGRLLNGAIAASLALLVGLILFAPRGSGSEPVFESEAGSRSTSVPSTARDLESFPVYRTPRERPPLLWKEAEADYPDLDAEGNEIPRGTPAF